MPSACTDPTPDLIRSPIHANNQYKHQTEDREGRQGQITVLYCLHTRYITCTRGGFILTAPLTQTMCARTDPPLKHVNQQARGAEIVTGLAENPSAVHTQKQHFEHAHKHVHTFKHLSRNRHSQVSAQRAGKYTETVRRVLRGSNRCLTLGSGGLCGEFLSLELKKFALQHATNKPRGMLFTILTPFIPGINIHFINASVNMVQNIL